MERLGVDPIRVVCKEFVLRAGICRVLMNGRSWQVTSAAIQPICATRFLGFSPQEMGRHLQTRQVGITVTNIVLSGMSKARTTAQVFPHPLPDLVQVLAPGTEQEKRYLQACQRFRVEISIGDGCLFLKARLI